MTEAEFVALVGSALLHVTAATNIPSIRECGLRSPVSLAALAGLDAATLVLRDQAMTLALPGGTATLNHQRPLRAGRGADFIDGMDIAAWSAQLDARLFFWPGRVRAAFAGSVAARGDTAVLTLDAGAMWRAFAPFIDIAPINTGSATRRPAQRGTWIYAPVTQSVAAFRDARRVSGLRGGRDKVVEVSLRCDIPAAILAEVGRG
jgi:hypothetical protein